MTACRTCGCTDDDCRGCITRTGMPCWWVEPDLCSACSPALGDPDKDTLRWIRDLVQNSDESHASQHYTAALELLQRLLMAKVAHAA